MSLITLYMMCIFVYDVYTTVYICRLFIVKKPRYIVAEVRHFENGPVVTASSDEWALKKQLYRYKNSIRII